MGSEAHLSLSEKKTCLCLPGVRIDLVVHSVGNEKSSHGGCIALVLFSLEMQSHCVVLDG